MRMASLAQLAFILMVMTSLAASRNCFSATVSLEIDNIVWQRGQLLPAYCDIPIDLGSNVAAIRGVSLKVTGVPQEGSMVICKGGCDSFPCHQTLHAYFLDYRHINSWTPLEGPETGYDFDIALKYADCYPDCFHPCTGKDIAPENLDFFKQDGTATLRLELMGDFDGCGTMCVAEKGIERITVTVDYEPRIGGELAIWGTLKADYR